MLVFRVCGTGSRKKKKKKKKSGVRNPLVVPMIQSRKGGPMKNKKDKRAKENKNPDYTKEEY